MDHGVKYEVVRIVRDGLLDVIVTEDFFTESEIQINNIQVRVLVCVLVLMPVETGEHEEQGEPITAVR